MFLCLKNQDRKTEIIQPQKQTTQLAPCKSLAKWLYMKIIRYAIKSARVPNAKSINGKLSYVYRKR